MLVCVSKDINDHHGDIVAMVTYDIALLWVFDRLSEFYYNIMYMYGELFTCHISSRTINSHSVALLSRTTLKIPSVYYSIK